MSLRNWRPKLDTPEKRLKACSDGLRKAMIDIDDPVKASFEARNWIKLACDCAKDVDTADQVKNLKAALERMVSGELGVDEAHPSGGETH